MSNFSSPKNANISFDDIFNSIQHWRDNKSSYPGNGIPDNIWQQVFQLESAGHQPRTLCNLFSLNSTQYHKKREVFLQNNAPDHITLSDQKTTSDTTQQSLHNKNSTLDHNAFAEVKLHSSNTQPHSNHQNTTYNSTSNHRTQQSQNTNQHDVNIIDQQQSDDDDYRKYLDYTTIIVECIRPDNHRIKIHTTIANVRDVIKAFFNNQEIPQC